MEEKTFQNRMKELRESTGLNRKEFFEKQDLILCYVQIQMKISPSIQFFMETSSYLHRNISYIFQQRKNYELRLKHRRKCLILS